MTAPQELQASAEAVAQAAAEFAKLGDASGSTRHAPERCEQLVGEIASPVAPQGTTF
jgi:hypothetical protein